MSEENFENNSQDNFAEQGTDNGQQDYQQGSSDSDFTIPEEYQNKGWSKFFDGNKGDELKSEVMTIHKL